jgi:hypothetical protein
LSHTGSPTAKVIRRQADVSLRSRHPVVFAMVHRSMTGVMAPRDRALTCR